MDIKLINLLNFWIMSVIQTGNSQLYHHLPPGNKGNSINLHRFLLDLMNLTLSGVDCINCFLTKEDDQADQCLELAFHSPVRLVLNFEVPNDDRKFLNKSLKFLDKRACFGHLVSTANMTTAKEILHQAAKWDITQRHGRFLIGPLKNTEDVKKVLDFEGFEVLPNVVIYVEMDATSGSPWYQLYTWNMERDKVVYNLLNEWSDGMFKNRKDMFPWKNQNMRLRDLKVAIWGYPPSTVVTMEGDQVVIDGTEMRIMKEFSRRLNFTFTTIVVDHQDWGVVDEFGNSTGILKECVLSTVDICLAGMYIDFNSTWFVNHTIPYRRTFMTFITPIPPPYPGWMALVMPFSFMMWVGTGAFMFASTIVLFLVAHLNAKVVPDAPRSRYCSYEDCVLHTISLLSQVGMPDEPVQPAVRHFTLWLIMTFILVTTCYGGGLLTFLTNPPNPPPVDTLADMVQVKMKWGAIENYMELVLMESKDPVARKLRYTFELHPREEDLLRRMKDMDFGIAVEYIDVGYLSYIEYVPMEILEHFHLVSESAITGTTSVMLRMGFPWKAWFDRLLYSIIEGGLITMWEQDVVRGMHKMQMTQWLQNQKVEPDEQPEPTPLQVAQLQGAFYFLAMGLGLSFGEFVLEFRFIIGSLVVKILLKAWRMICNICSKISQKVNTLCRKSKDKQETEVTHFEYIK